MATERKKIGIIFISNDIGVIYYLVNIVKTLNYLNDSKKPEIIVFFNNQTEHFLSLFDFKNLKRVKVNINNNSKKIYLKSIIQRENLFYKEFLAAYPVDVLFPFNDFPVPVIGKAIVASWIPDFQHKFYPYFFSKINLYFREIRFKSILKMTNLLVLSSNDALLHLKKFYKHPDNLNVKVLQFVSTINDHIVSNFDTVKEKYQINLPFFLVSNQFYEHKNHIVVLKAIKILKDEGFDFEVIFTGKTEDYRNQNFYPSILNYIKSNKLSSHLKILGLIAREDQLSILKESLSIIQPSKFEGWSTIIEDAKTLRHKIICSSIPVHIEQLGNNGVYFSPDSYVELADKMRSFIKGENFNNNLSDNYENRVIHFAESFMQIFK
jgi:glycosyltransferase involved in cell wall biosynthesis